MNRHTLFIRIEVSAAASGLQLMAQYADFDASGRVVAQQTDAISLSALLETLDKSMLAESQLVVLLPADKVYVTTVTMPAKQLASLIKVPAYLIEEQLAEPIESLQVAAGRPVPMPTQTMAQSTVAGVNRAWLQSIHKQLEPYVFFSLHITSEACLLTPETGHVRLLVEDGFTLLTADGLASRFDNDSLLPFLHLLAGQKSTPSPVLEIYALKDSPLTRALSHFAGEQHYTFKSHSLSMPSLLWLAGNWLAEPSHAALPNLALKPITILRPAEIKKLSLQLALITIAWLICQFSTDFILGIYLNRQAAAAQAHAAALYRQAFPTIPADAEAIREFIMRENAAHPADFTALLTRLSAIFAKAGDSPHISQLQYRAGDKTLIMAILASDFSDFERYRKALGQEGISASVDTLTRSNNGVKGNVRVNVP